MKIRHYNPVHLEFLTYFYNKEFENPNFVINDNIAVINVRHLIWQELMYEN